MTNQAAVSDFQIVFGKADGRYNEGDEMTGMVTVELREDIVIESVLIEFCGHAHVEWQSSIVAKRLSLKNRNPNHAFAVDENYLNQTLYLYRREDDSSNNLMVSSGRHVYPFSVQLPSSMASSFRSEFGSIKYFATATLERPWCPSSTTSKDFTVTSIMDLNAMPQTLRPLSCQKTERSGLLCCLFGQVVATWRLDRTGYLPGERIQINGEIHNNSRVKMRQSKVSLIQHVRYHNGLGESHHSKVALMTLEKGEIETGAVSFWREEMDIPPRLPPTGLKGCSLMDLWYTLKMRVVSLDPTERIENEADIVIGTVSANQIIADYNVTTLDDFTPPHATPPLNATPETDNTVDLTYFV